MTRANAVRGRAAAVFDALVQKQTVGPWLKPGNVINTFEALLDRIAMTFPYPDGRDTGSPAPSESSPWAGITRKAFWLYGETWDNSRLGASTLRHIEEIIGPVNVGTYRQVGAFVRSGRVVNELGLNDYVKDRYLAKTFASFDSLWLHGERSGMFEKQTTAGTVARLKTLLKPAARDDAVHFQSLPGFGHLDSLIGREAHLHGHRHVLDFLAPGAPAVSARDLALKQAELAPYMATHPAGIATSVVPDFVLGPACSGPFFTRTLQDGIRVWFFVDTPLGNILQSAHLAVVRQKDQQWTVVQGWNLKQARRFAALKQFAAQIAPGVLRPGDRVVAAAVMSDSLGEGAYRAPPERLSPDNWTASIEPMSDAGIRELNESLPVLFAQGSFVTPVPAAAETALALTTQDKASREFWVGSCRYPGWLIDKHFAHRAHAHWLARSQAAKPEALLLVGDQVYVDAMGNFVGDAPKADMMAGAYVEAFGGATSAQSPWLQLLRNTSLHCMMDDHELSDNYSLSSSLPKASRDMAFEAFALFQGPSLPTWRPGSGYKYSGLDNRPDTRLSGEGVLCGCPAYYLDTRYHRSRLNSELFCAAEFEAFESWASVVDKHLPKFIVTASVLMPVLATTLSQPAATLDDDTLNGYPAARDAMLGVIVREGLRNVIFLSGDLHLSCHGRGHFNTPEGELPFAFCVSSGIYSPMPFANARTWDLPAPHTEHYLAINSPGLPGMSFTIEGVTEQQALARIAVVRRAHGPEVAYECMGADGLPLLTGTLVHSD